MQNTIVKEFAHHPRVATAVMSQAESRSTLEKFWRNVYLRGQMIFDPTGETAQRAYAQPDVGFPFGRAFVIGPQQTVVLPLAGYDSELIIDTIYDLLDTMQTPGDFDWDGDVDLNDYAVFFDCFAGPGAAPQPKPPTTPRGCLAVFDFDDDKDIDLCDFGGFGSAFTGD